MKSYRLKSRSTCLLFLLAGFFYSTHAQILQRPVGASYTNIGAYSLNHIDIFSFLCNQASLAQIKNTAAGVYTERRFLLNELNYYSAAVALTTRSGNFGLKTMYSGFTDYNETQIGLAYARKLGEKVDIGIQFNYNGIRIANYGSASAISFEAGSIFHLMDKLHAGFHINNPIGGKLGKDKQEKLPFIYTAGLGYDASKKFLFSIEIVKEEGHHISVNAGIQYKLIPKLLTRIGVSLATSSVCMGAGVQLKLFRVDITTNYHPQLGVSPGLLLIFDFKPKAN